MWNQTIFFFFFFFELKIRFLKKSSSNLIQKRVVSKTEGDYFGVFDFRLVSASSMIVKLRTSSQFPDNCGGPGTR